MKSRKSKLSGNLIESAKIIKENRKIVWFVIAAFAFFMFIAIVFQTPSLVEERIKEALRQLVEKTENLDTLELTAYIFTNNLWVSLLSIFLGIFFCIAPFVICASNGYVLGFVVKMTLEKLGTYEGIVSLWRLFPHGIFEIPAVILSMALGIKLGFSVFNSLNKKSFLPLWIELKKILKVLVFVVLPLLVVAAIIEGVLIGVMR